MSLDSFLLLVAASRQIVALQESVLAPGGSHTNSDSAKQVDVETERYKRLPIALIECVFCWIVAPIGFQTRCPCA